MKKQLTLSVLLSLMASGEILGQTVPRLPRVPRIPVPGRTAPKLEISKKLLGTDVKHFNLHSANFSNAVRIAMPKYSDSQLESFLKKVYHQSRSEKDSLKIRNYDQLQGFFKLPSQRIPRGKGLVESRKQTKNGPQFAYGVNPIEGSFFLHKNFDQSNLIPIQRGEKLIPSMSRSHLSMLQRVGIPSTDLLFHQTNINALELKDLKSKKTTTYADSFLTYGLRQYKGIMVEESHVKVTSLSANKLEGMEIVWPKMKFHPQMTRFKLKNKNLLMREVISKIGQTQRKGQKINVRMAVVLRPYQLKTNAPVVFGPALKVGVKSLDGEAGQEFYVDLSTRTFEEISMQSRDS